jgi:hypothetical protein
MRLHKKIWAALAGVSVIYYIGKSKFGAYGLISLFLIMMVLIMTTMPSESTGSRKEN